MTLCLHGLPRNACNDGLAMTKVVRRFMEGALHRPNTRINRLGVPEVLAPAAAHLFEQVHGGFNDRGEGA